MKKWKIGMFFLMIPLVWGKDSLTSSVFTLLRQSNYQKAIQLVEEAIKQEPDIANHYLLLSEVYRHQGRYSNALATVRKAYQEFPSNPWVMKELADVYRGLGEYRKALALYQKGLLDVSESQKKSWFYGMGVCYYELEEYEKAEKLFEAAIRGNLSFWALYYLGKTCRRQKRYQKAIWAFERSELQLSFQPSWASNTLYYEWGSSWVEWGIVIKATNTLLAKEMFERIAQDKRFADRRVQERVAFWLRRL